MNATTLEVVILDGTINAQIHRDSQQLESTIYYQCSWQSAKFYEHKLLSSNRTQNSRERPKFCMLLEHSNTAMKYSLSIRVECVLQ